MDYTQNPEDNSKPDESNFMFLAALYGGRNVTTSSSMAEAVPPGRRHRDLQRGQLRQHASKSRLLDVLPYNAHRRILHTSEYHEVHLIPSQKYDGYWILQEYLLAISS
jgi:hypothetical protein